MIDLHSIEPGDIIVTHDDYSYIAVTPEFIAAAGLVARNDAIAFGIRPDVTSTLGWSWQSWPCAGYEIVKTFKAGPMTNHHGEWSEETRAAFGHMNFGDAVSFTESGQSYFVIPESVMHRYVSHEYPGLIKGYLQENTGQMFILSLSARSPGFGVQIAPIRGPSFFNHMPMLRARKLFAPSGWAMSAEL